MKSSPTDIEVLLICSAIIGVALNFVVIFLIRLKRSIDRMMSKKAIKKAYQEKIKEREDMLARGELHEWVTIKDHTMELMVCKKTGWVPERKIFLSVPYVKSFLIKEQLKKDYEKAKLHKADKMADKYGVWAKYILEIHEELLEFKKQYYLDYMADQIKKAEEESKKNGKN